VKTFNLKALFEFAGCVVEKILVETIGVQVSMRRDRRTKPHCPHCQVALKEVRKQNCLALRNNSWLPAHRARPTPFFPPSGPPHRLFQGPPAKSKFLAASQPADFVAREFGSKPHRRIGIKWYWWETALVLAVLIALAIASLGDW
jgi:hypothetical protein